MWCGSRGFRFEPTTKTKSKMWLNNGGDMNPMLNSTMNSAMGMNAFMSQMMQNFNANNRDVFDFSLHSSSMQQGTESSTNAVPVSIQNYSFSFYYFHCFRKPINLAMKTLLRPYCIFRSHSVLTHLSIFTQQQTYLCAGCTATAAN